MPSDRIHGSLLGVEIRTGRWTHKHPTAEDYAPRQPNPYAHPALMLRVEALTLDLHSLADATPGEPRIKEIADALTMALAEAKR